MSQAVLLSCHGSVSDLGDMPAFLSNIRRGRPAPKELLDEVVHRYQLIGGSPLMRHSREQARLLEERLAIPVRVAGRLWHPYPSEVLAELVASGATEVLSLPLAPQSVELYNQSVSEAASAIAGLGVRCAPPWGLEPALIEAFLETVDEGLLTLAERGPRAPSDVAILLTAHSLPLRVIRGGDAYEAQFRAMANAIAAPLVGRGHQVEIAFQSQGASAEPWLGPDLATSFAALAGRGIDAVLVAPVGFLAEHVETLYDLDVEAPIVAGKAGLKHYARAPAVGARPKLIDALEVVARRALGG